MEFHLLGALEVEDGGQLLRFGGRKERALLALLALRANEVVPRDRLIEGLWQGRPPASATHSLEAYISRLRKLLGEKGRLIESQLDGYRLCLPPEQSDVARFERLIAEGWQALAAGEAERAAERLGAALSLWRRRPFADLAGDPLAEVEADRLEELRLAAIEGQVEARLALGRHSELVGELQLLVSTNPFREGLVRRLMVALYRCGRQADALEAYQQARRRLVAELGIEPGRELQQIQEAILRHDPGLDAPVTGGVVGPPAMPRRLPPPRPVPAPEAVRDTAGVAIRRTVSVVYGDVTDSAALRDVDPEMREAMLDRFFSRIRAIAEVYGGTVEMFAGDAVVAVFGIPVAHEDDATRAVCAAAEMREAMPELGLDARIAVNTGTIVSGAGKRLALGDVVHVAARLERAARPGEVLLGERTVELVERAVAVEHCEAPDPSNGTAEPVTAFRLVGVHAPPELARELPFVGRERELALVQEAWQRACRERCCELVTVVGDAGLGKSRLIAESLRQIDATVVEGRCLPYGNGITYWPVVEIVKQLRVVPGDGRAAAVIRSLLGESDAPIESEEIAWAVRKALEQAAKAAPIVVVFDDIHHGEETFLELIEHITLMSSGAPILLLCMARPELVESHPAWPVALHLEPLSDAEVEQLTKRAPPALRRQILRAAGGNPLFVTEMLALTGAFRVPPTLQALLAARLDQLEPDERRVLEGGAIEGEVFHCGAVRTLVPDQLHLTHELASLVHKGLIRQDKPSFPDEDAFRFRHLLVRDAAYEAVPKSVRAELHERFASWVAGQGAELVELDEILGYHLEQAANYTRDLGGDDTDLAERAGARLASAGRRALWRGDERAGAPLLERALALTRPRRLDVHLEVDLADALGAADRPRARAIAATAAERARADGDPAGEALAETAATHHAVFTDEASAADCEARARAALPLLEARDDHVGLARVWDALGEVFGVRAQWELRAEACEQTLLHIRLAGRQPTIPNGLAVALVMGPRPADEALQRLTELLPEQPPPGLLLCQARLLAMLGRFAEAWPLAQEASARWRELGGGELGEISLADIAFFAGDHAAAVGHLRTVCDWLEEVGNMALLSRYMPYLAHELCATGRHDEAEPLAERSRRIGQRDDMFNESISREAQALVLAHHREYAKAEALAREAVAFADRTDSLLNQALTRWDLGEVLEAAGRTDDAVATLEQALDREERKRNLALAQQLRERLAQLQIAVPI